MRKLSLELEALAVDSFETGKPVSLNGTVQGQEGTTACDPTPPVYPCTCANTCLCHTNYYYCGTGPHTIYSCDFTANASCLTPA